VLLSFASLVIVTWVVLKTVNFLHFEKRTMTQPNKLKGGIHHKDHVIAMQQEEHNKNCFKVCVFGDQHVGKSMLIGILQEMLPVIHVNNNVVNKNRSSLGGMSRDDMMLKVDNLANTQQTKPFATSSCSISVLEFPSLENDGMVPEKSEKSPQSILGYNKVQLYEVSSRAIHLRLLEHTACGANLFVFVFDLSMPDSLESIQTLLQQTSVKNLISEYSVPLILIGNKLDLQPKKILPEKVTEFQQHLQTTYQYTTTYFEISCLRCNFAVLRLLNHILVLAQPTVQNVVSNNQLNNSVKNSLSDTKKNSKKNAKTDLGVEEEEQSLDLSKLMEQITFLTQTNHHDTILVVFKQQQHYFIKKKKNKKKHKQTPPHETESALPTVRSAVSIHSVVSSDFRDLDPYAKPSQIPNLPRNINKKEYDDGNERALLYD
jgi:GTPase SAR1 family protein